MFNYDDSISTFNDLTGRLRVSVTPSCQLSCQFCHTEGNVDHGAKKYMDVGTFENILHSFSRIGGRELNITGGEPLLHPQIRDIFSKLEGNIYTTLSTNGLLMEKVFKEYKEFSINQFKVSLHSVNSTPDMKDFLGKGWDYPKLRENIQLVKSLGYDVILNYTLTSKNFFDLERVIEESIVLDTDLKIIDLGEVTHHPKHALNRDEIFFRENYVSPELVVGILDKYSRFEKEVKDKVGNFIQLYKTDAGKSILLKDKNMGKLHTRMCEGCDKKEICNEGVFALRLNTNGTFMPCILNDGHNVQSNESYTSSVAADKIYADMVLAISNQINGKNGR